MAAVCIIACDHGFGHVRRSLLVASCLAGAGHDVTVFAPAAAAGRFPAPAASVRVVDFSTCTTVAGLRDGTAADWHLALPNLSPFDLVVSDNLPEILLVRPDAVLSGGFLWHQALPDMHMATAERARDLLRRHCPPMVTSALFAAPELLTAIRAAPVGLVVDRPPPQPAGTDLLIACGGSTEAEAGYARAIAALAKAPAPTDAMVWVEPRLLPVDAPTWMRAAPFDPGFHTRLAACVCRPGVGTLTDCLWAGARIFAASEAGNREMAFNARRVVEARVGAAYADADAAVAAALAYLQDRAARDDHRQAAARLDFGGLQQTVAVLGRLAA